jgi:diadenosine tetraphosphate (Ap4A) HIT family hydrolase
MTQPWRCDTCGFDLWKPLARLSVSTLGFYDDARFPGRCILTLNAHFDHLIDVPLEISSAFMADMQSAGRAIDDVVAPERINFAVLGNTVAHVHCHIIPRLASDPTPTRPPWEHPDRRTDLPTVVSTQLRADIAEATAITGDRRR